MYFTKSKKNKSIFLVIPALLMLVLNGCNEKPTPENSLQNTQLVTTLKKTLNTNKQTSDIAPITKENIENDQKKESIELFFTDEYKADASKQTDSFDCHQKMYAVLKLNNYTKGVHQIDVEWIDPFEKTRERTSTQLYVAGEHEFSWSALTLKAATGANLIAWANPAAGMEEFLGEWIIKVFIDKKLKVEKRLSVSC